MVRHKNRYIVVEIRERNTIKDELLLFHPAAFHGAVFGAVQQLHGDFGAGAIRAGFVAKYCNPKTRIAVIRARHGPHKLVASALPYIRFIDTAEVYIISLFMGATLKHCYNFIKCYQQKKFDEFSAKVRSDEEKEELKKMMMNFDSVLATL